MPRTSPGRRSWPETITTPATLTLVLTVLSVLGLGTAATAWDSSDPGFVVVVHADNPVEQLDAGLVARAFLDKLDRWDGGQPVEPIDLRDDHPTREAFSRAVIGRSVEAVKSFWQRSAFSGQGTPPPEVATASEVFAFLQQHPGGIAYVPFATPLPPFVHPVQVIGEGGAVVAGAPGSGDRAAFHDDDSDDSFSQPPDEVIGVAGPVVLILTGRCGPEGAGRHAVLANRDPYGPRSAKIQVSTFHGGELRGTRSQRYDLEPVSEDSLGCTHPTRGSETRYLLAEVSDASLPPGAEPSPTTARLSVHLVAGGSCGRGAGRVISLVNQHPRRTVRVSVEHREVVEGSRSRNYQRSYQLEPGATRSLGCDHDGPVHRTFTLTEAEML